MNVWRSAVVLLALTMVAGNALAASVKSIRLWRAPDNTRLVFDLTGPASHKLFTLGNPDRLVIDIAKADMKASLANLDLAETPIKKIRSAARNGSDLRVVLDLKQSVRPKSFSLKKHGDKLDRLVVDLFDKNNAVVKTVKQVTAKASTKKRNIIIAIDAGHGGEDPGALGPKIGKSRPLEKNVVLAISKELAKLVDSEPGYRAELVRTGDYYIPLRNRRNIAREKRADLFVSIHADAFKDKRAKGASVFALSRRGATSETARFLAQKENEADLIGGVGNVSLEDKDQVLAGVLVDLSMTATLSSSLDVGGRVLKSMDSVAKLHKPQVEQAGFAVLKSPDVPSILVETGFISNPDEAKKLSSSYYRKNMAKSIFKGIKSYFNQYPPAGSYVAWKKNGGGSLEVAREHVIARGDTLSGIAQRYNVSVNQIRSVNSLSGSVIRVGQRLKIPASG
jgi:N-acetylmuramoyl-L-alanine amidase